MNRSEYEGMIASGAAMEDEVLRLTMDLLKGTAPDLASVAELALSRKPVPPVEERGVTAGTYYRVTATAEDRRSIVRLLQGIRELKPTDQRHLALVDRLLGAWAKGPG